MLQMQGVRARDRLRPACGPTARACRCWSTRCWSATTTGSRSRPDRRSSTRRTGGSTSASCCGPRSDAEAAEARAVALASTLQQTLVPPLGPGRARARGRGGLPAGRAVGAEVGGDFYDVFQVGEGDWVVAIGDVCGKGVRGRGGDGPRPLHAAGARRAADPPSAALAVLNEVLLRHETDRFCTVGLVRLRQDADGWHAVVACGGHPLPLLRRADGSVSAAGVRGTLLGVMATARTTDTEVPARPGRQPAGAHRRGGRGAPRGRVLRRRPGRVGGGRLDPPPPRPRSTSCWTRCSPSRPAPRATTSPSSPSASPTDPRSAPRATVRPPPAIAGPGPA